ncbi:probable protein phosphatase 2C 11 [Coccomyxa sp. Obi]|nr:probable protein phosphatase 2C 11 [Coccomyxa sp. Obi]
MKMKIAIRLMHASKMLLVDEGDSGTILYAGVFDRHGGVATADWLKKNLDKHIEKVWQDKGSTTESDITDAFLKAVEKLLQPKSGFFGGMGERGVGGSKCGSTAAVALVFREGGATKLLAANVGDARVLLSRKGCLH